MVGGSSDDIRLRDTIYAGAVAVAPHDRYGIQSAGISILSARRMKTGGVTISYALDARQQREKAPLTLEVFDCLGKRVYHAEMPKRSAAFSWNGASTAGKKAGQGIFLVKMSYKGGSEIVKCRF
jgi:hypothetical protein